VNTLVSFGMINLIVLPFCVALVLYDLRTREQPHGATVGGGLLIFFVRPIFLWVANHSAAMHALGPTGG
jgi:hypothetical protein